MNRVLDALPRWLSLAVLIQFAVWLCSGLFFAAFPIEEVHGEHVDMPHEMSTADGAALLSAATAIGIAAQAGFGPVEALEIHAGPADRSTSCAVLGVPR